MAMRQHRLTKVSLAVIALTLCFVKAPASADEVIALKPRSGVIQKVLLWEPRPCSEFRRSSRHFEDMAAVVRDLKSRYPNSRLVLLGHSRGTVSAAYVAQALGDRIAAVILMSGFYDRDPRRGVGLSEFDFDALKTPLLIVHHVKDMCPGNLFGPAQKLTERLPAIVVDGPDEVKTDWPCAPGTNHWFAEKEKDTMDQMFNWIYGRAWTRLIR